MILMYRDVPYTKTLSKRSLVLLGWQAGLFHGPDRSRDL